MFTASGDEAMIRFSNPSEGRMAGTQNLWLFIVSGLLLNITPGPDSLFIMARSATQGWRAGFVAAWGVGCGVFVHVFAAALGLSALLATSATAFTVVKVGGAAYLVWMGAGMLFKRAKRYEGAASTAAPAVDIVAAPKAIAWRAIFVQGF